MVSSIGNIAPPASALTKMGVSPVNSLEKYNINVSEHNKSFINEPQVRPTSITDQGTPKLLETRGALLDTSA